MTLFEKLKMIFSYIKLIFRKSKHTFFKADEEIKLAAKSLYDSLENAANLNFKPIMVSTYISFINDEKMIKDIHISFKYYGEVDGTK
jgi:hypothetical protein